MAKIALGTWAWGTGAFGGDTVFGSNNNVENLKPVFDAAMNKGLNLWDTARAYGMGESEKILGSFVAGEKRENVEVSTKFTPQLAEIYGNSVEKMAQASMERMGIDYIDIYWIHNPMDVELDTGADTSAAVGQGKARGHVEPQHRRDTPCQRDSLRGWFQGIGRAKPLLPTLPFIRERRCAGLLQGERY